MSATTRKASNAELVHHWLQLKNGDRIPNKNALTRKMKNLKIWDWRWMRWDQGWHRGQKAQKEGNFNFYNTIFDKDGMPLFEEVDRARLKALQNYYRRHPDRIPHETVNPLVAADKFTGLQENNAASEAETEVNSVALHNGVSSNNDSSELSVVSAPHSKVHNFMPRASVPAALARQSKVHNFLPSAKKSLFNEDWVPATVVNPMARVRQSKVHNFVPGTKRSGGQRKTRRT